MDILHVPLFLLLVLLMNERLRCILSHIPAGIGLIDVGTDHGYLPVALAENGYAGRLFASDLRPGPLSAAKKIAGAAGVADRIGFQLCDGLADCDPGAVDTIVIAGMGGDTICGILDRAEWCTDARYTLILQPMTRAEVLRYWLTYNEFAILQEDLVKDRGIVYPVMIARFGGKTCLTDAELFTGARSLLEGHPLFGEYLEHQKTRFQKILDGLDAASNGEDSVRRPLIATVLSQLEEMTKHEDHD